MQIESVAHCGAASLIQSGGTTSHRVYSSPIIETPLLETATHSGSDLRPYDGAQPEIQNEQSDLPSYQEVMRGRFVELTPGEYGLEINIWQDTFLVSQIMLPAMDSSDSPAVQYCWPIWQPAPILGQSFSSLRLHTGHLLLDSLFCNASSHHLIVPYSMVLLCRH